MEGSQSAEALAIVTEYVSALIAKDRERMDALRSEDYSLDFVHDDAKGERPHSRDYARSFWSAWFVAFPDADWEFTRTIVAEAVVVCEGIFTATHTGPLGKPVADQVIPPTGRTVRFRGAFVYDLQGGLIQRETCYLDVATFWVELGVVP